MDIKNKMNLKTDIYQILKNHKLGLKKREELIVDLLDFVNKRDKAITVTRCSTQLPNKDEIYSSACEYARKVQNPNRNISLTLRRVFKNGAMFIKNKLED